MATFKSDQFPADGSNAPIGAHGEYKTLNRLHAKVSLTSAAALNDTINVGYLPPNAIVTAVRVLAATQLDSNGSPALTLDLGIVGTTQLWQAAISTVGRAVGASTDSTIAAGGVLYKNTSGAKLLVVGTIHAAAATAVAGTLEYVVDYFVEE